jgi:hypothetical protein
LKRSRRGHSLSDRKWLVQTINYANAAGVDWCALTNGAEWRIYKVHAQVEADRKLFTAVAIDNVGALDDAVRVLSLLSRENMRARAVDELWQTWHVDSQMQTALELTLQDDAFAALIRKRVPQLALTDVRKSLRRASITASYPDISRDTPTSPTSISTLTTEPYTAADPVPKAAGAAPPASAKSNSGGDSGDARRRLLSTQKLFELGRVRAGETLTIRGRENPVSIVLDCLPDGRALDQLRDQLDTSNGAA